MLKQQIFEIVAHAEEIVDIVMAPRTTEGMLFPFELQYYEFSNYFKLLYPRQSVRPKMHFLVRFPTIVRKNGPMRNYWTMHYESLNDAIKKPAHTY